MPFFPLPWGEGGERSEPGEGVRTLLGQEPPHPNPLPAGEREKKPKSLFEN
jgi:hypothetical protein